jgi:hypothetical protein
MWRQHAGLPQCARRSLDEDEQLRSDAEFERFLRSLARPGADYLS